MALPVAERSSGYAGRRAGVGHLGSL